MHGEIAIETDLSRVRSFASTAAFFVFSHAMMADSIFFSALRCVPRPAIASRRVASKEQR
jgi:hypothetical protein